MTFIKNLYKIGYAIEYIATILLLPVAILHESYHYLMALALNVKVDGIHILSYEPGKPVNRVECTVDNWYTAAAVTAAPFIFGAPLFLFAQGLKELTNANTIYNVYWWMWFIIVMSIGAGSLDFVMTIVYLKNAIINKQPDANT